jgi:Flavodoxin-like fold
MNILNIVTSPRKDQSASRALVDAFLREYMTQADDIVVDTLDVWQEWLPEFDAETINAKYKGVSGEPMTPTEVTAWEKIRELASRFQRADRIVMGVPMWNFSFPYKLKQLIDLSCQRNNQNRNDKAECRDAVGDLTDLFARMGTRVPPVGRELVDRNPANINHRLSLHGRHSEHERADRVVTDL